MHDAARKGDAEAVKALLTAGADPTPQDDDGRTPLHDAAENGDLPSVQVLLTAGANPNARDDNGRTSLHDAAENGRVKSMHALLAAEANPDARDDFHQTPLHLAARNGSLGAAQALLAAGASVNAKAQDWNDPDDFDETPLHLAAGYDHLELVRALLTARADPNAESGTGHTPMHYAARGNIEMIEALVAAGGDPNHAASDGNLQHLDPKTAKFELRHRCELAFHADCSSAGFGWTPLHVAARCGSAGSVQALFAAGADENARALEGETPLHVAVVFGCSEFAFARSGLGDDPAEGNRASGAVPRDLPRYVESAKVLLNAGADPSARTRSGVTPLDLAVDGGFFGD